VLITEMDSFPLNFCKYSCGRVASTQIFLCAVSVKVDEFCDCLLQFDKKLTLLVVCPDNANMASNMIFQTHSLFLPHLRARVVWRIAYCG